MIRAVRFAVAAAMLVSAVGALAQQGAASPQNVLQLSASGTVEVQQDLLSITLGTTRDASDAATVQAQLKTALDAALAEARKSAQPGQLDVRTGDFSLAPRYTRDGKINGWQGSADIVLEGRDFSRITQVAGRLGTLSIGNVAFGLSREQRAKTETEAQSLAVESFKQKAAELAREFGFSGYTLREAAVNASQGGPIRPQLMAARMASVSADAPVPVEPGKTAVVVNVSGSVQLK